jgi:hypothetical protein
MSHELRTPLNAIIGLTEMMVTNAARFGTEKAMEPLQRVNRAGTHLLGLINQVLDLSKIEAGKLELNPQTVQLVPLIDEVVGTARQLADALPVTPAIAPLSGGAAWQITTHLLLPKPKIVPLQLALRFQHRVVGLRPRIFLHRFRCVGDRRPRADSGCTSIKRSMVQSKAWLLTFLRGSNVEHVASEILDGLSNEEVGPFGRITYYPMRTSAFRTPLVRLPDEGALSKAGLLSAKR